MNDLHLYLNFSPSTLLFEFSYAPVALIYRGPYPLMKRPSLHDGHVMLQRWLIVTEDFLASDWISVLHIQFISLSIDSRSLLCILLLLGF